MCAAADALAVSVEQHHLDAGEAVVRQHFRRSSYAAARPGSWRRAARRNGRNRNSRTGGEPAGAAEILAPMWAAQGLIQHHGAAIQRLGGLEQRADLDPSAIPNSRASQSAQSSV